MRNPLPGLQRLVDQMRGDLFHRWMARAQKATLIEWRDRMEAPGLAARFTHAGNRFYGFGDRSGKYWGHKGMLPDYVKTGSFRDMQKARSPKTIRGTGTDVVTRLRIGGGVLSQLTSFGPVLSEHNEVRRVPIVVRGYTYNHHKTGTLVTVASRPGTRRRIVKVYERSSQSYAEQFLNLDKDRTWLADRVRYHFERIVFRAAIDKHGELRSNVLEGVENA